MSSSAKKVRTGLGGFGDSAFDVVQFSDAPAPATAVAVESPSPEEALSVKTSSVVSNQQAKKGRAASSVQNTNNRTIDIPAEIASGHAPIERSGKRRVGVSRKYNDDVVKTTMVLPTAVHDKLVEIVFRNRKTSKESLNDLVMQGLDNLFQDYGLEPIDKIVNESKK